MNTRESPRSARAYEIERKFGYFFSNFSCYLTILSGSVVTYATALFLIVASSLTAQDALYLTWQNDPTTTMTIQWLSDLKSESDEVEVQKQGETEWKKVQGTHKALPHDAPHFVHTAEVKDLTPDTRYTFRLPQDQTEYAFRTMPKDNSKPIRFAVGGDAYHDDGKDFEEMAKKIASTAPQFFLLGGDIAYSVKEKRDGIDKFDRWLGFLQIWTRCMKAPDGCLIPLIPAIGNHEVVGYYDRTPDKAQFFYALFACPGPQGYKLLTFGKYMAISILDTNHTHPIAGAQTEWLRDAMRKSYSFTHRFAIYHVPAYPSVRYFRLKESCAVRKHWVPLFERYSLHAAFENHEHCYKRTHPLIDNCEHPKGVLYFGDGSLGVKPRIPKRAGRTSYLAKTKSRRQFLQVTITKDARYYEAIASDGEIIDSYTQKVLPPEEF